MLSLQEISDRLEIQQLIVDYANAIDAHDFDALDDIFTPDAFIDYTELGGIKGDYPEIKAWLKPTLGFFKHYNHLVGNMGIRVAGDAVTGRVACFNPMRMDLPDGTSHVMFFDLWYHDKYVRTPKGWRIFERIEEKRYDHNMPVYKGD